MTVKELRDTLAKKDDRFRVMLFTGDLIVDLDDVMEVGNETLILQSEEEIHELADRLGLCVMHHTGTDTWSIFDESEDGQSPGTSLVHNLNAEWARKWLRGYQEFNVEDETGGAG